MSMSSAPRVPQLLPSLRALAAGLALACLVLPTSLGAQEGPAWIRFEEGRKLYESGRLGEALVAFRASVDERRTRFEAATLRLDEALEAPFVPRAEGSIDALIRLYADRDFIESERKAIEAASGGSRRRLAELYLDRRLADSFRGFLSVLDLVLRYRSWDSLRDSLPRLRAETRYLSRYPEAEFWIGRVYQREGELALARAQYERVLSMKESWSTSEDLYEAGYALSETLYFSGDMAAYERSLLGLLEDDPLAASSERFLLEAMERTLSDASGPRSGAEAFDKFMTLYRTRTAWSQRAWRELARFYRQGARERTLIHAAIAVNAPLTRIIERIAIREPRYVYTSFGELVGRIVTDRDYASYAESSGIWESALYLADAMWLRGNRAGARSVWSTLSTYPAIGAVSRTAAAQLASPRVVASPAAPASP